MKLGMWVVTGTGTTHVDCHYQMCIFNTSFAYLFWLANNKKIKYPEFCMGTSTTHVVCCHQMHIFNTHLHICSHWLITKIKYPEFCMGYIDETWYVGSDGH